MVNNTADTGKLSLTSARPCLTAASPREHQPKGMLPPLCALRCCAEPEEKAIDEFSQKTWYKMELFCGERMFYFLKTHNRRL